MHCLSMTTWLGVEKDHGLTLTTPLVLGDLHHHVYKNNYLVFVRECPQSWFEEANVNCQ